MIQCFSTPRSGIREGKKSRSRSTIRIRDEHPGTYFRLRELKNNFLVKIPHFFYADLDPGSRIFLSLDPRSGMEKFGSWIRDKYPGSATLLPGSASLHFRIPHQKKQSETFSFGIQLEPVLWIQIRIRIHRIHMFLVLLDPDPDPLVRGMDPDLDPAPDPDPSIIMQK
jgi:hypothetical protein